MEHKVNADGVTLHVETDGVRDQPALLLWPSGFATVRLWDHLLPTLSEHFFVVRVDVRGWGKSVPNDHTPDRFTFEQYTRDACGVLDYLEVDECHVWSQSWGSRPAMHFSATQQARTLSAALYAANTESPDVPAQREGTRVAAERRRAKGIPPGLTPADFQVHDNSETARFTAGAMCKFDLNSIVEQLTMPVLIGTGDHDPNLSSSRDIARRAPQATLVEFEDVGHNAILEHPQLALATFLEFHLGLD